MAAFNKFNSFVDYLFQGKINLATDAVNVLLTNTAPVATNAKYSDISANELASGNGYQTGGAACPNPKLANNAGTESYTVGSVTFTSQTGNMGPFRYAVFYDTTSADKPLIGFYDYGSSVTLNGANGETLLIQPQGALLQAA